MDLSFSSFPEIGAVSSNFPPSFIYVDRRNDVTSSYFSKGKQETDSCLFQFSELDEKLGSNERRNKSNCR
jgi:hypothetical protein